MLRVERHTPSVVSITIDRPQRRNAVDVPTLAALSETIDALDPTTDRVVVLSGSPPAFCAGADLTGVTSEEFHDHLSRVLRAMAGASIPIIAAVDGPALGAGTQLVAVCDLRIASRSSVFGIPAARLGLAVDQWTVDRVVDEFGMGLARSMLIAAEQVDATVAYSAGVVHRLGESGAIVHDAHVWAEEIAQLAPLSIRTHREMLRATTRGSTTDVDTAALRDEVWASADANEGRAAFLEKRPARFTGR